MCLRYRNFLGIYAWLDAQVAANYSHLLTLIESHMYKVAISAAKHAHTITSLCIVYHLWSGGLALIFCITITE